MGQTLRGHARDGGGWRRTVACARRAIVCAAARVRRPRASRALTTRVLFALVALASHAARARAQDAPERIDRGRFTAVFYPGDALLVQSLIESAMANDTFPGLPRPKNQVLLAIAPDARRFRDWIGPEAPEWGAAITFPDTRRIVMQGRAAGADAGDPRGVLRHELAHLALHEYLGDLPPRWFDEGYASYAAHEWTREDALTTNVALALKGTPTFAELDSNFSGGATTAQNAYALGYRAVVELAGLDTANGLTRFFQNWHEQRSMDRPMDRAVRVTYGITLSGFEKLWQQRTRRRYGALALVSDVTFGGLLLLIVIVPLYIARRQRDRVRMAALVLADEAAERAARAGVIEALLRGDDEPDLGDEPGQFPRS
jgi:hypothetical protein